MHLYQETERKVLSSGIEISYLPGEYLFRCGQQAEYVFYIVNGSICLETPDAQEYVVSNQSIFLGINESLHSQRHFYSTHTVDASTFLVFEKDYFLALFQEFDQAQPYFLNKQLELDEFLKKPVPKL